MALNLELLDIFYFISPLKMSVVSYCTKESKYLSKNELLWGNIPLPEHVIV